MKKMKLDLACLTVETFDTTALASARGGTVHAFDHESVSETELVECTRYTNCQQLTCGYGCPSYLPQCLPTELEYPTCGPFGC
ncbi:MAG TPA: hypothetical protein VM759_04970 [Longimicrobium sp.]|nr:hypothetical protein [Longimicrobium sp.]